MTTEQRKEIKKEINKAISHIARGSGLYKEEIESILVDDYVDSDDYTVICWPEIQFLMPEEGFEENACLVISSKLEAVYGSSAYFVNKKWLNSLKET